ncbi:hypothetical protein AXG93_3217s1110 [Marchantia polymorpha subsp. ruderalis]|uniref:GHMP kinase C-terminal domain-containing protein n=1 Tax=Marchantia polymorpha subsp. ruderalis TaxID=1480154 RepID=A0A176VY67_MARPO|nr:hypothetical protein AXG93_3217s1110 [Marchantia polymorpha subsp. ruderalis]
MSRKGLQVHSDVRKKWLLGDKRIRELMADVAQVAEKGRASLLDRDYVSLATLMDRNFDLRRQIFGDDVLGDINIKMVETARSVGAACKFTGSGGAVVAFCPKGRLQAKDLMEACESAGFSVEILKPLSSNGRPGFDVKAEHLRELLLLARIKCSTESYQVDVKSHIEEHAVGSTTGTNAGRNHQEQVECEGCQSTVADVKRPRLERKDSTRSMESVQIQSFVSIEHRNGNVRNHRVPPCPDQPARAVNALRANSDSLREVMIRSIETMALQVLTDGCGSRHFYHLYDMLDFPLSLQFCTPSELKAGRHSWPGTRTHPHDRGLRAQAHVIRNGAPNADQKEQLELEMTDG